MIPAIAVHTVAPKNQSNASRLSARIILLAMVVFTSFRVSAQESSYVKSVSSKPVFTLVSLQARQQVPGKITIDWMTGSEIKGSHFIMQRSINGGAFTDAALIFIEEGDRSEAVPYRYNDPLADGPAEKMAYRLKMVDQEGHFTFSKVVNVKKENADYRLAMR